MVEYRLMSKLVKIAVIGVGKLGSRHADVYSTLRGVELVGVCDIFEDRAKDLAAQLKTRAFKDYRDLIGLVDAASIVVPSHDHYRISKHFLENKVNLLIEKPFTTNLAHADELLKLAKKNRVIIQVGHIERFNSAIRTIKNIIKNPRFIECHRLGPYYPNFADVGVTLDLMIHDIDIVLDLINSPVRSVSSVGASILSKTEDLANARLEFANKAVCNLTASRVNQDVMRKIKIFQDDAYISLDYVTQEASICTKKDGHIHHQTIDIKKSNSLREELSHFVHCVQTRKKPLVSGEEAREALALALKISNQIHKNKR